MADLTEREYFHRFKNVKTLPLARLQAREDHVEALKALAHLTRLEIFFFLVREGREVPAGEIQNELEVPGPTLSHHLDVLRRAGLVQSVREEPLTPGATVRSVLAGLSSRYPELAAALWHGSELGEHIEVLVNDAVLGIAHSLDSPLKPGDRITLLAQFMGGA